MIRVSNRLAAVLEQRQWSHAQLADATDIPYATVRRLVQRTADPPLHHALGISEALAMPVESLFAPALVLAAGIPPARLALAPADGWEGGSE